MTRRGINYRIEIVVMSIFLYAGVQKLLFPDTLVTSLVKTSYLTTWLIPILVFLVPLTEISASLLLILKRGKLAGMALAYFLMTTFTIHLILLYHFSPGTPCSCGGLFRFMDFPVHLVFNLIVIALILYWLIDKIAGQPEGL